ncbi:MAG: Holliday junction resolvase RuvX [Acidaminococcales bacterium]|jgi:putative Holliday junction resolvase|nr:Holliday junction resolvase RuvX [Acidaminococcales bacterium]
MRFLGLDLGDKIIGVAVSDQLGITAQGVGIIRRAGLEHDLEKLSGYMKEYAADGFVIGYPKNMNGTIGERALLSGQFAALLQERFAGKEVILWDERLTTAAAQKVLIEADVRRRKRKTLVDKLAAVLILQGYLDNRGMKNSAYFTGKQ